MKMFGFDTLDWRQVKIDWDAITDDIIKAGTPMDKDGHICNDGNVFGILMDDVQRKRNVQGRVVISGCMDMKAAEEHSGIKLSAEAKAALPDVWTQSGGGVSSWNDLPGKPDSLPYVEKTYGLILPETTVEIDPENPQAMSSYRMGLTVGNTYTVKWNGTEYTCVAQDVFVPIDEDGNTINLGVGVGDFGAITGGEIAGEPFLVVALNEALEAESGAPTVIYALDGSEAVTLSISGETDIIHPIDERCLPMEGRIQYIDVAMTELRVDGASGTYQTIKGAAQSGVFLFARITESTSGNISYAPLAVFNDTEVSFLVAGTNNMRLVCNIDGTWELKML